jgi:hypothetical protein
MKINRFWYRGIYPDIKTSKLNCKNHYVHYGVSEGRIPNPFIFSKSHFAKENFYSAVYVLFLMNELTLNSRLLSRFLKFVICHFQYLRFRSFEIDLLVITPWLRGGVFESFCVYDSKYYSTKKVLILEGIENTDQNSDSPMILSLKNFGNLEFRTILFFPSEVIMLLSKTLKNKPLHINHFFGLRNIFYKLLKMEFFKILLFIHDYYLFSEYPHLYNEKLLIRFNLEDASRYFPNIQMNPETVISRVYLFILPSKSVQNNLISLIPESKQLVLYPPEESNIESNYVKEIALRDTFKVLILGHLGNYKGLKLVSEVISYSHEIKAPFSFFHIGKQVQNLPSSIYTNFSNVNRNELSGLISELDVDFAWLPFQCEETYSFTLSDIFRSHLPLISTNLGAVQERCWGRDRTLLLDPDLDAHSILDFFRKFVNSKEVAFLAGNTIHSEFNSEELNILRNRDTSNYQLLF